MRMHSLRALFFATILFSSNAYAVFVCTQAGTYFYDFTSHAIKYCAVSSGPPNLVAGVTSTACTAAEEGKIVRSGNILQFCNNTNWQVLKDSGCMTAVTSPNACNSIGTIRSTMSGRLVTCQSGKWYISSGSCTTSLACTEIVDSAECVAASCSWAANKCDPLVVTCSGHTYMTTCNNDTNCTWNGVSCDDNF